MLKQPTEILCNKNLSFDFSGYKRMIESANYHYYDFSKQEVIEIADKDIFQISNHEIRMLIQALFPEYIQCSGIFNNFIFFEVRANRRLDPPKYYYGDMTSYLNNDDKSKVNRLAEEVKDLFEQNGISYSESWKQFFDGLKKE